MTKRIRSAITSNKNGNVGRGRGGGIGKSPQQGYLFRQRITFKFLENLFFVVPQKFSVLPQLRRDDYIETQN